MTNIKERILYFIDYQGEKKEDFFSNLGLSYANFKGIQKKSSLGSDSIDKILTKYKQLNAEWLVTGRGDMLRTVYSDGFVAPVLEPASIDIGERLKAVRERNNYSLTDFAESALKIDKSQYSKIEQGKLSPTLKQCIHICGKFSVSMDWLIFGSVNDNYTYDLIEAPETDPDYKALSETLKENSDLLKEIIKLKDRVNELEKIRHGYKSNDEERPLKVAEPDH